MLLVWKLGMADWTCFYVPSLPHNVLWLSYPEPFSEPRGQIKWQQL